MKKKVLKKIGKISIIEKNWYFDESSNSYICEGKLKNTGIAELKNLFIIGCICKHNENKPLKIFTKKLELNRLASYFFINSIKQGEEKDFLIGIEIPNNKDIIFPRKYVKNLKKYLDDGLVKRKIFSIFSIDYSDSRIKKLIKTRDTESVISEEEGIKNIELTAEEWETKEAKFNLNTIISQGKVKNTGNTDIEDISIISLIIDKENNKPLHWDTNTKTYKGIAVFKIDHLKSGEEAEFKNTIVFPRNRLFLRNNRSIDKIDEKIEKGEIIRKVEILYERGTAEKESIKRLNLGNSYFRIGNYQAAIKEYEESLKLNKEDYRLYFNIGLSYYKLGNFKEAMEYFQYLHKKMEDFNKSKYFIGLTQQKLGFYDEALLTFMELFKTNPNDYKIAYNIACIYFKLNETEKGFSWLEKSLQIDEEYIKYTARKDRDLIPLRENQRFINLIY